MYENTIVHTLYPSKELSAPLTIEKYPYYERPYIHSTPMSISKCEETRHTESLNLDGQTQGTKSAKLRLVHLVKICLIQLISKIYRAP